MTEPAAAAKHSDTPPDPAALRTDLEATRSAFHALLGSLSTQDWRKRDPDTGWTTAELLTHLALSLEYTPQFIRSARKGKNWSPLPERVLVFLNGVVPKILARGASPASVGRRYDAAHAATLDMLPGVDGTEWHKTTRLIDGRLSIEEIVRLPAAHFKEHAANVQRALQTPIS
jgi:hypothetical protein